MHPMKIQHIPYNLRFKYPFTISKGTKTHQPTLVVSIEQFGLTGYGEAPAITYYGITVEKMLWKMQEKPWPIYKIKLGTPEDIYIIRALRKNTNAVLRVDANAGWNLQEALDLIPALHDCGVEFIEQPPAKDNLEGMRIL